MYRNITIKEQTHFQDQVFNEVYLVVKDVKVESMNQLIATVLIDTFKSKLISETHSDWKIKVNEFENIDIPFAFGDSINADTIAGGIKYVLLDRYPTWNAENIVIE